MHGRDIGVRDMGGGFTPANYLSYLIWVLKNTVEES